MKTQIAFVLAAVVAASPLYAESPFERELATLTQQRDKDIAAATEPITRRYRASLEQLLRKATQDGDFDAGQKTNNVDINNVLSALH